MLIGLARIFHPSLLRKPGTPMAAALDLNFDQDSMDSYSPDKNPASALPHQPSRLSRHESHEISGLARIFHGNSSRGAVQPGVEKQGDGLRQRLYVSYCPRSNPRVTQYTPGSRKPQQNCPEIFWSKS